MVAGRGRTLGASKIVGVEFWRRCIWRRCWILEFDGVDSISNAGRVRIRAICRRFNLGRWVLRGSESEARPAMSASDALTCKQPLVLSLTSRSASGARRASEFPWASSGKTGLYIGSAQAADAGRRVCLTVVQGRWVARFPSGGRGCCGFLALGLPHREAGECV